MTDYLEILREFTNREQGMPNFKIFQAIDELIADNEKLRANEEVSKNVMRKWASDRVLMSDELDALRRNEFICKKCGLRKDGDHPNGDF